MLLTSSADFFLYIESKNAFEAILLILNLFLISYSTP